jgi:hypothetical protein
MSDDSDRQIFYGVAQSPLLTRLTALNKNTKFRPLQVQPARITPARTAPRRTVTMASVRAPGDVERETIYRNLGLVTDSRHGVALAMARTLARFAIENPEHPEVDQILRNLSPAQPWRGPAGEYSR